MKCTPDLDTSSHSSVTFLPDCVVCVLCVVCCVLCVVCCVLCMCVCVGLFRFTAISGQGAFLNDRRIRVSQIRYAQA
jgi:hypothetical protein